jgi:ABC-type transport system involved in multi-copper enzyme maturation permease subunit
MTSAAPAAPAATSAAPLVSRVTGFGHLLRSEWTKIRSVRSTVWTLIVFVVVSVGLTALFALLTIANWTGANAASRNATVTADPVSFLLGTGINLGQFAICVLGVLVMTSEYSTGVIRASLLAVPRRTPMLAAKAVVFAALILVMGEIVTFSSFFIGSAILRKHVTVSLSDPGVARAVIGTGLVLAVLGVFALAIGALVRHTAGAIATVIGVVLVLPILSGLLPGTWGAHINAYLPEQAGGLIAQAHQHQGNLLSPWQGFGVFCLWTAVLLGLAAYLLRRRDA